MERNMASIFPNSNTQIDQNIVAYCEIDNLIPLSRVNQRARELLSNHEFFKGYYQSHYPTLKTYRLFTILRSVHPSICWKVMCKMMKLRSTGELPDRLPSYDEAALPLLQAQLTKKQFTALQSSPAKHHRKVLKEEIYQAFEIESAIISKPHLKKCTDLIAGIIKHPKKQTSQAFAQIQQCIDACSYAQKTLIWGALSDKYVNGLNIEDTWTLKHFKVFLPDLQDSLLNVLAECDRIITDAETHLRTDETS
jgi:hypothetical protein